MRWSGGRRIAASPFNVVRREIGAGAEIDAADAAVLDAVPLGRGIDGIQA